MDGSDQERHLRRSLGVHPTRSARRRTRSLSSGGSHPLTIGSLATHLSIVRSSTTRTHRDRSLRCLPHEGTGSSPSREPHRRRRQARTLESKARSLSSTKSNAARRRGRGSRGSRCRSVKPAESAVAESHPVARDAKTAKAKHTVIRWRVVSAESSHRSRSARSMSPTGTHRDRKPNAWSVNHGAPAIATPPTTKNDKQLSSVQVALVRDAVDQT